jgi:hypothetical protein
MLCACALTVMPRCQVSCLSMDVDIKHGSADAEDLASMLDHLAGLLEQ